MKPSFSKDWERASENCARRLVTAREDMISQGYSVRYWQKVEAGKPITLRTLLRICRLFSTPMADIVRGLDEIPKRRR